MKTKKKKKERGKEKWQFLTLTLSLHGKCYGFSIQLSSSVLPQRGNVVKV